MQKKLLTLAVAGALAAPGIALAQSSVEVYGFINMHIGQFKFKDATDRTTNPDVSKFDVMSAGSNAGVRGRETLGGGLSAWFQIETNTGFERSNNVAHTSGFASRNSAVGLQGGFGNVFIGQWTTPWADLDSLWSIGTVGGLGPVTAIIGRRETTGAANNFNCSNAGSGTTAAVGGTCDSVEGGAGVGHAFWRRVSNAFFYQSPVFAGGAQAKFAWQTNQDKAAGPTVVNQDPSLMSGSVQWAGMGGRARIGLALDRHKDFTTPGKTDTGWAIKGGWNFGVADIGLALENNTYKTPAGDCKAKQYGVALAVPVGQGAIRASYAKAKDIEGTYTGAVVTPVGGAAATGSCGAAPTAAAPSNDNGATQWNLGYDHRFSKRTTVGFGYATIKNDAGAGGNTFVWSGMSSTQSGASLLAPIGTDISVLFANIVHRF
ncbi:MAG TPA: porin [Burkholderiales bacterium]|nr:porin [Burkholderiales bacterium]